MKKIILSSIFISACILLGSVYQASALSLYPSQWTKCTNDGGTLFSSKGPEYSYDSCRFVDGTSCNVFDGSCDKKLYTSLDQLPSSCINAHDGCNNCFRASGGAWACTLMACLDVKQPAVRCTGYADTKPVEKPAICTKEYTPVCGNKHFTPPDLAPYTANKTYSNKCMMQADGASLVSDGACSGDMNKPTFCTDNSFKKLNRGTRGDHVRALQQYLSDNGYNPGTIDGVFGRRVVEAVRAFQKDRGIKQDGVFGNGSRAKICNQ